MHGINSKANPILMTDFYKTIHHLAYASNMEYLVSYWTPRMSRKEGIDKIVVFGLQAFIKNYLMEQFKENFFKKDKSQILKEYERVIAHTMSPQAADSEHLSNLHDLGYLPIYIKALPEGTRANIKTPTIEIGNTLGGFGWLVNYLETLMSSAIWFPMTTATLAYQYRDLVNEYYEKTISPEQEYAKSSACGDFSMRGISSPESAMAGSAGHLLSFTGTATIPAILWLEEFYNCDCTNEPVGKGVPSTEHSVMSSYGRDGEFECYRQLITEKFPTGLLSIVSDTYDYWNVVTNYLPRLRDEIMSRQGKIIIRGDSGDPVDIICGTFGKHDEAILDCPNLSYDDIEKFFSIRASKDFTWRDETGRAYTIRISDGSTYNVICNYTWVDDAESSLGGHMSNEVDYIEIKPFERTPKEKGTVELLWEIFGGYTNAKGYKVLDPHIGAIYGDSITFERAKDIYSRLEKKGFAISNVTLGIGSYTYQYNTRDTFGFALKATNSVIDGKEVQLYKDPITDTGNFKKSQRGMCVVYKCLGYKDDENILYKDGLTIKEAENWADNLLTEVFRDGKLVKEYSLSEIRQLLHNAKF